MSNEEKSDARKKYKDRLPNKLIHIKNADKSNHEKWYTGRNLANFPKPFQMILTGSCNSGKTNTLKNIILRARPLFDKIIVIHADANTKEYDDLDVEDDCFFGNSEIPQLDFFEDKDENEKWLCIIEDAEFTKANEKELSMLFRYISTHKNVSIMLSYQDFVNVPKIARRLANVFVLWKMRDLNQLAIIEKRVGLKKGALLTMFDQLCPNKRDSLCFDFTKDSPAPIRLNIFDRIIPKEAK
jgi:hypothetical protein